VLSLIHPLNTGAQINININKATDPDEIEEKLLKELRHELAEPIYIIFRRSLDEQEFPSPWKRANVTPIYKKR
jgi:hypothetical protein